MRRGQKRKQNKKNNKILCEREIKRKRSTKLKQDDKKTNSVIIKIKKKY